MNWRGEVVASLRESIDAAGFLDLDAGQAAYATKMNEWRSRGPAPVRQFPDGHPLHGPTLANVYAFGATVAQAAATLTGLPAPIAESRADWAGRFNLGISLFDYVCDIEGGGRDLASRQPFAGLAGVAPASGSVTAGEAVAFLVDVASDLVSTLRAELSRGGAAADADPLWQALTRMLQVQLRLADRTTHVDLAGPGLCRALSLKAAEPFRVMAEWMSLPAGSAPRFLARDLGRSIGRCVWAVDDAHDVWADLRAGQPNLFLVRALREEGSITLDEPALAAIQVHAVLSRHRVVSREFQRACARLARTIDRSRAEPEARRDEGALLAAAMLGWV